MIQLAPRWLSDLPIRLKGSRHHSWKLCRTFSQSTTGAPAGLRNGDQQYSTRKESRTRVLQGPQQSDH